MMLTTEPTLANARKLNAEPILAKLHTDNRPFPRCQPLIETDEPYRAKLLKDTAEPRCTKSKIEALAFVMNLP